MSIDSIKDKVLSGAHISKEDALEIAGTAEDGLFELFRAATLIRETFRGKTVEICSIVNAKSGACSEDCSYCAQSSKAKTPIKKYPLMEASSVIKAAKEAKGNGAKRFCIVTSGRKPPEDELKKIASMVSEIREIGLLPCATLGILDEEELMTLKEAGLIRYHHNIETSERFFPCICSTHTYEDKLQTIRHVKASGLSLCSGGIFGLGEGWEDRVEMAFLLRELDADSIPINFLMPQRGTPLEGMGFLNPIEALKIISLYRFIHPKLEIRVCGGRPQTLGELGAFIFMAGADGLLIGNYLTTQGAAPEDDLQLIGKSGLEVSIP
jgi:biotin synthase